MAEIASANCEAGFHFFDRKTLEFFDETMRSYRVQHAKDGRILVIRKGGNAGDATFVFNPATGDVVKVRVK